MRAFPAEKPDAREGRNEGFPAKKRGEPDSLIAAAEAARTTEE